jgi:hypothetical protein
MNGGKAVNKARVIITIIIVLISGILLIVMTRRTPQFEVSVAPYATIDDTEITFSVDDSGGWWPIGESLVICMGSQFSISNGTQVVTMTGPITITKVR